MDGFSFISPDVFNWMVLPLLIFCARIVDVSLDTMRIIYIGRGMKTFAAACGFFGVLIWITAITQVMQHLSNFVMYITYAAGYATGNFVGIMIERRLAVGLCSVKVVTHEKAEEIMEYLSRKDGAVAMTGGQNGKGEVYIVTSTIRRKDLDETIKSICNINPQVFVSVYDIRAASESIFRTGLAVPNMVHKLIRK